jgi:hypothetical protein
VADRWQKVGAICAIGGIVIAAFGLSLTPTSRDWANANSATLESFELLALISVTLGLLVGLIVGSWDHLQAARIKHAKLRTELAEAEARRLAFSQEQERAAAARATALRAWDSVGPFFRFRASEKPQGSPEIDFSLPARSDSFRFDGQFPLAPTCSLCPDHPVLRNGQDRNGTGDGLCCHRCGTVYTTRIPGLVTSDAGNAIIEKIRRSLSP